ncbi:6-phosphogluconolactonase [Leptospira perdikensis]|uniref:6-phosphogluconolactonase n=1 Tax=Leptospira perdikensis TaxID=2484948 RepID=A0A4R9JKX5_9LEPT|nr:6-phosphogluconolactonase [Leptospira perdikensis]TGL45823.1 6-phosphogluconolactonase [Leptospira perdikensis]
MSFDLVVCKKEEWTDTVLDYISKTISDQLRVGQKNGNQILNILVSGGTTPIGIYKRFHELPFPWQQIHLWQADERCFPENHLDRNDVVIKNALGKDLLSKITFHSMAGEEPLKMTAFYQQEIQSVSHFDLSILGIGEDGHTASLFPGNDLGDSTNSVDVIPVFNSPKLPLERISLSVNCINRSSHIVYLASGESKKDVIEKLKQNTDLPASKVKGRFSTKIFYSLD